MTILNLSQATFDELKRELINAGFCCDGTSQNNIKITLNKQIEFCGPPLGHTEFKLSLTEQTIVRVISSSLCIAEELIRPEHDIIEHLGADSLDRIELTMEIEDEFNIELSDSSIENVKTVEDIFKIVNSALKYRGY